MELAQKPVIVRQVFEDELEYELRLIQSVVEDYPVVSIDTEFPNTVFKPDKEIVVLGNQHITYHYMKSNVDILDMTQLGLTFSDCEGDLPDFDTPFCYVWEFNFKSCGKNRRKGIDSRDFATMFWNLGLFKYFRGSTWMAFHGSYDFGFLVKILTQQPLPYDIESFMGLLVYLLGDKIFDAKHTFKCFRLLGSLDKAAKQLNVVRLAGSSHQAGSDSLLTLQCFNELRRLDAFGAIKIPTLALYGLQL
ncbi:Shugoshin C terminus, putative isoform 1 [Hibiscus syriacus]|uniref:Shugoshin C terminus, putative isoform 1 n=1 Tax=Hibiscus syriacus TaxID=106335 RepID=A0A6A2ZGJ5_HIBSY|nr:probable CCR4-associated factor 1 homolog 11 [Hibiscus syriacus]KAE8690676.1 Shugoshin C terminus, putative isoform 1 [Hibiscus syriacus]